MLGVIGSACSFNNCDEPKTVPYVESKARAVCNVSLAEDGESVKGASISDPKTLRTLFRFRAIPADSPRFEGYSIDKRYVGEAEVMGNEPSPYRVEYKKRPDGSQIRTPLGFPDTVPIRGLFEVAVEGGTLKSCTVDGKTFQAVSPIPNPIWHAKQEFEG
jgi:hypothetical protein